MTAPPNKLQLYYRPVNPRIALLNILAALQLKKELSTLGRASEVLRGLSVGKGDRGSGREKKRKGKTKQKHKQRSAEEQIEFGVEAPTSARMFRMTAPQTSINFFV